MIKYEIAWSSISWIFQSGGLRGADQDIAKETKACVLATFMCIVVDEQFQKAEDEDKRIYHWNGIGATEEKSNLKDRKLWEKYHWQSKLENGELKDLPQHKDLKDYILKIFVKSSGKLDWLRLVDCDITSCDWFQLQFVALLSLHSFFLIGCVDFCLF